MMISVIVVVHNMPRQAMNTIFSLSCAYQQNTRENDYEIIVVENSSPAPLDETAVKSLGRNIRYFYREESGTSPAPAINFARQQARGDFIGLIIDGARMVTPRVLEYAAMAFRMTEHAIVMVPGYHLGESDQKGHLQAGHNEEREKEKLEQLDWKSNGYRLFDYACFSSSNQRGYFQPMQECNAIFCSREFFDAIGGADERFNMPGGGSLNLHIYRKLGLLPDSLLFVLPGEGSFHQFHHGVTTSERPDRDALLKSFKAQLDAIWDNQFKALTREPIILGSVTCHAQKFLEKSAVLAEQRFNRLAENQAPYWEDDSRFDRFTENMASDSDENKTWKINHINPPRFWF